MELLTAAQQGDERAFGNLIDPFRGELHAHCYRMLGSVHDAEDALQEATLRAWRGLARFEGRSSLRSWLYTIATNTCLNHIARRPKRVHAARPRAVWDAVKDGVGEPLIESVWVEPYPDERLGVEDGFAAPEARYERRESVELAFIAAIQHLPATQRAVLILRDVLGFSAREVAESLDTTVASANSALQRARKTVDERFPERASRPRCARSATRGCKRRRRGLHGRDGARRRRRGRLDARRGRRVVDAAARRPGSRAERIRGFLARRAAVGRVPLAPRARARQRPGGERGLQLGRDEQTFRPFALDVLTLEGDRITEITSFISRSTLSRDPEYYARFPDQPRDLDSASAFERFGLPAASTDATAMSSAPLAGL